MDVTLSQIWNVKNRLQSYKWNDECEQVLSSVRDYDAKCGEISFIAKGISDATVEKITVVINRQKENKKELIELKEQLKKTPTEEWKKREIQQPDGSIIVKNYTVPVNESLIASYKKRITELAEKIEKDDYAYEWLKQKKEEAFNIYYKYDGLSKRCNDYISHIYDVKKKLEYNIFEIISELKMIYNMVEEIEEYKFTVSFHDSGIIKSIK